MVHGVPFCQSNCKGEIFNLIFIAHLVKEFKPPVGYFKSMADMTIGNLDSAIGSKIKMVVLYFIFS